MGNSLSPEATEMIIIKLECSGEYGHGLHELLRVFYPGARIVESDNHASISLSLQVTETEDDWLLSGVLAGEGRLQKKQKVFQEEHPGELKWEIFRFVYAMLVEFTERDPNPYGVLTGVRPTKIVHRLLDAGVSPEEATQELEKKYLVRPAKARLLTEVVKNNRALVHGPGDPSRLIGIYMGIPYCPSRCHYCSFPGYPVTHRPGVEDFLQGLEREIGMTGAFLKKSGIRVESIYIGGGTPTVLTDAQWASVLDSIQLQLISPVTREFTVEAGRPDTVKRKTFDRLLEAGVTRFCINPQTMNDQTLEGIGRRHTSADIVRAFAAARETGCNNINMDLIIGLPGEGVKEVIGSLERVLDLGPEGITAHVLARKRGSRWDVEGGLAYANQIEVNQAVEEVYNIVKSNGYLPYYLYRQKYMQGNAENIGYSRPGFFCHYNIQIIEERQTTIGLGGGASSKFVNPKDLTLTSMYHPGDPASYLKSLDTLVSRQVDKLLALS
ncbi:MAG: coproporphyrinogen dehydrogenase HemZ [Chitinophagales bacterium]